MKRFFKGLAVAGMTLATSGASASDYGCQVLLCLANPNGATAVQQCRPPIERLYRDLRHGHDFPSCDEAKPAHAQQTVSYYDPCPSETTVLALGARAMLAPPAASAPDPTPEPSLPPPALPVIEPYRFTGRSGSAGEIYIGTGELDHGSFAARADELPATQVCVGRQTGTTAVLIGSHDSMEMLSIDLYDQIVLMDHSASPRAIDVYIDGQLYRRVRW